MKHTDYELRSKVSHRIGIRYRLVIFRHFSRYFGHNFFILTPIQTEQDTTDAESEGLHSDTSPDPLSALTSSPASKDLKPPFQSQMFMVSI